MSNDDATAGDRAGAADGGRHAEGGTDDVAYLEREVNLLRPSTPFMRDHLRLIRTGFVAWVLLVFGPVTATALAPDLMTTQIPVIEFPLHYFAVAIGAPGGSLVLSFWYTRRRDRLDERYGIDHGQTDEADGGGDVAAADGGVE
jgi:putative solute:sodium symporter small subunit